MPARHYGVFASMDVAARLCRLGRSFILVCRLWLPLVLSARCVSAFSLHSRLAVFFHFILFLIYSITAFPSRSASLPRLHSGQRSHAVAKRFLRLPSGMMAFDWLVILDYSQMAEAASADRRSSLLFDCQKFWLITDSHYNITAARRLCGGYLPLAADAVSALMPAAI